MIARPKHRSSVEVCADCGASDPSWASINRGLLLCAECCSVHRSMGRHISHVKSLRQGIWPPSLLVMVQTATAQNVNSIWEHSLLDTSAPKHLRKKPQPKDPLHPTKSEFILAKHLRLAYVLRARRDETPNELGRQLHSAVRSSSLDTAMRLLAQGADPNYYNQEKGTCCLHVACRAGQPSQAELLVAWGADPAGVDHAGHSPADIARVSGHTSLSERLASLTHEAPARLAAHVSGERPRLGERLVLSRASGDHEMTDVAKAARGKLQLLPNHLFEELVMDIYDEIDRRETEAIWQTSATGLERCGVVFLPVNPALSAPRNQGRQKLARLSTVEMTTLLRDVLLDATRRQHIATLQPRAPTVANPHLSASHLKHASHVSDDEPLYDSVASDEDYAALTPLEIDTTSVSLQIGEPLQTYTTLFEPPQCVELRINQSPSHTQTQTDDSNVQCLKKELDSRDSTISELKSQLKNLQSIVEQLTRENSVLKTNSYDDTSIESPSTLSPTNGIKERGRSVENEAMVRSAGENEMRQSLKYSRPVSMFEARERPKNRLGDKNQLSTLGLDRSTQEVHPFPTSDTIHRRAELITRGIQDLWSAAREQDPGLVGKSDAIRQAVIDLLDLFPQTCSDRNLNMVLAELRAACEEVTLACTVPTPLNELSSAAYNLAKATKLLVTHFTVDAS